MFADFKNAKYPLLVLLLIGLCACNRTNRQKPNVDQEANLPDLPTYSGNIEKDNHIHDARQPWAIGIHSYGIFRAHQQNGKTHDKDGRGYRFNHHPNLVYWDGYYWVSYQGGPTDDIEGKTPRVPYWITYSADGRNWEAPEILFPSIQFEGKNTYMHSRMGFYVTDAGKLLSVSFHGRHDRPNWGGEWGVARVVREIHGVDKDGRVQAGPVYAIRFNENRNTENTGLPFYKTSEDVAFVKACEELLANPLVTQQWFEEDRRPELYTVNLKTPNVGPNASAEENVEAKAFDWYSLPSGRIVGWWKAGAMAYSDDDWKTVNELNIDFNRLGEHRTAKLWGQRVENSGYAIVHNIGTQSLNPATEYSWTRTPMVVIASSDGIAYEQDRAVVFGDVAPSRYINPPQAGGLNDNRDGGPQYVRGISESNTNKPKTKEPTGNIWVTYSVNKEDIWISEIPANIRYKTDDYPKDDFEAYNKDNLFRDWIILSPAWASVTLVKEEGNQLLRMEDKDPYDYAKVMRVFKKSEQVRIEFQLRPHQKKYGRIEVEITDRQGFRAVSIQLAADGMIHAYNGRELNKLMSYTENAWLDISIAVNAADKTYSLNINGEEVLKEGSFLEEAETVERLEMRTGTYRMDDFTRVGTWKDYPPSTLENPDMEKPNAVFDLDNVSIAKIK